MQLSADQASGRSGMPKCPALVVTSSAVYLPTRRDVPPRVAACEQAQAGAIHDGEGDLRRLFSDADGHRRVDGRVPPLPNL